MYNCKVSPIFLKKIEILKKVNKIYNFSYPNSAMSVFEISELVGIDGELEYIKIYTTLELAIADILIRYNIRDSDIAKQLYKMYDKSNDSWNFSQSNLQGLKLLHDSISESVNEGIVYNEFVIQEKQVSDSLGDVCAINEIEFCNSRISRVFVLFPAIGIFKMSPVTFGEYTEIRDEDPDQFQKFIRKLQRIADGSYNGNSKIQCIRKSSDIKSLQSLKSQFEN